MKSTIRLLVIISIINLAIVAAVARMAAAPSPTTLIPSPSEMSMKSPVTNTPTLTPTTTNPISKLTPTPTPTPTPAPTPVVDNRCLITIDGARYDMTQFRNTHSGGDIFICGGDMSSDFWGQHGQKELNKIQQYRI